MLAVLYTPLAIVAIFSFNTDSSLAWPPKGFTLEWWRKAWHNAGARDALFVSLRTAVGATVVAVLLGTAASFAGVARPTADRRRQRSDPLTVEAASATITERAAAFDALLTARSLSR